MKAKAFTAVSWVLLGGVVVLTGRCSPDWYAEIPCATDLECPADYHCEAGKCTEGEAAGEPGFEVGTSSLDFGEVQVGQSATKEISVKNSAKSGSGIMVTPALSKEYKAVTFEPKAEVAVKSQSSVKLKVTYRPTAAETIPELYLVVTSNETGKPMRKVRLSGSAIAPRLETDPAEIVFPPLYRGATADLQRLRLMNTGSGDLSIEAIEIEQTEQNEFYLSDAPTSFPVPIEGNGMIEFNVGFRPMTEGDKSGLIKITTNEYNRTEVTVSLSGEGQACPEGFYDVDGNSENKCEYECRPKAPGDEVCDNEDNDCDGDADNAELNVLCPNNKAATHADYRCVAGKCVIEKCDGGWQNWDRDDANGCEAECKKTDKTGTQCNEGDPGCGVESCDGIDNNCDGKTDNAVMSDMCPDRPNAKSQAAKCEADPKDGKTKCIYICDTGYDNCVGEDDKFLNGCPQKIADDVGNCGGCGKVCAVDHAVPRCAGDKCEIESCDDTYFNLDGDHSTGCEYGPCTKTDALGQPCDPKTPGCGVEICDGNDNNCDGTPDNAAIDILCPAKPHTTFACDQAKCMITACENGWHDVDKDLATGCECQAVGGGGGDTCGAAKDMGSLADNGGSLDFEGNLTPAGKAEWYKFVGADNQVEDENTGCDKYHVAVKLLNNPGSQYAFDVYVESCDPQNPNQFHDCNDFSFTTAYSSTDQGKPIGECPCTKNNNDTIPHCDDDTRTYYVRVFRPQGAAASCEKFKLELSNAKYKP
ncbi:MAG: choice-of-anchor D domain-containing protein [Deltaproteobacteria bacterium]|nr:choice-of-anchor D domain-containing protein [Deltaproteobacteria bacterium]